MAKKRSATKKGGRDASNRGTGTSDRATRVPSHANRASSGAAGASAQALPEIPRWLPPTLFAALAIYLFRDFVFSDRMLFGGDTLGMGYVVRDIYAEALRSLGRVPGWAPHILGGTPFLEALSGGDSLYPPSVLLLMLTEPYRALGWKLVLHIFLAGIFFFGWTRSIGGSRAAALLGGTAYMLAPFLVGFVHPGHDGKIFVTALAPLLFWATERHFVRPGAASVAGIGLVIALVLYTTHFQMAYFLFGGVGLYAMFRAVQIARGTDAAGVEARDGAEATRGPARRPRVGAATFGLFLVAAVLGASGAAYQFVPAIDYVMNDSRRIRTTGDAAGETGRAWSSSFSMNPEEAMSLIVPEFAGNAAGGSAWATNTYWGRNGFKDNHEYAGLIVLLLAAASFMGAARKQLRFFFTGLGVLSLAFALGANTPIWGIFYAVVPGIRLFRAPGMAIFLFGFGAITLASLGLDRILELVRDGAHDELARLQKVLWMGVATVGVIAFLITSGLFTTAWTSIVYTSIGERQLRILAAHLPNIVRGASIALLLAAATAGVVWALGKGGIPVRIALAAIILLVVVDEARIDAPFIQTMDFPWSQPDPNLRVLLDREQGGEPYRLWSLARASQDVTPAVFGIELAAGHHPNDLARYRDLIGMAGSSEPRNLFNANVRRILNVKYILWPDNERGAAPEAGVISRTQSAGGQPYNTLLADVGLPRARLVSSAVVKDDADAVAYIMSAEHDPEVEAVLTEAPPVELDGGPIEGSVTWVERGPDRMQLRVESDRPALLIIADNWFPAWRASVDGEAVEVLRAYHTLRAVPVSAGVSTIDMWYESTLLKRSLLLSILVLSGLAGVWGFGLWRGRGTTS
jgi:hypothetical protein